MSGSLDPVNGDEAILESEWIFTSATTFQEEGAVAFGRSGHRLRFSTFGSAYLGPATEDGRRRGVAIRWVEGGVGQFAGARGLIVSALVVDDAGEVTDHQLGMVDVR